MKLTSRPAPLLDVAVDLGTMRLIRLATAVRDAGWLPTESARSLTRMANAVRSFAIAGEPASAVAVLDEIDKLMVAAEDDSEVAGARDVVSRGTDRARRAFRPLVRPAATS